MISFGIIGQDERNGLYVTEAKFLREVRIQITSESGVKEVIFGRIKAYNLVQMFQFVTEAFETCIKREDY